MAEAILINEHGTPPHPEGGAPPYAELRLLSVQQNNSIPVYDDLALLSKRRARSILRIGNDSLNILINNGDIKVILVNNKEKIPYVSLHDYVYKMSINKKPDIETCEYLDEEESVAMANKIINDINKGGY